ncbi:RnfABCDGE type electron transport complex subunit D [Spirochaeta cellobiosiphila]|uniref:RnfABCDGE type electron transport complex subunit D n=1 Tax=Spirochaeta cellobiosiphila TaxID=504483 RepID=UPI000414AFE9|nr:RnfABCDGE type electron transport complex subunit D [Spirochaeta cellobiosiphila]
MHRQHSFAPSSYLHSNITTKSLYFELSLSLVPALVYAVYLQGFYVLFIYFFSFLGGLAAEGLGHFAMKNRINIRSVVFYSLLNGFLFSGSTNVVFPFLSSFIGLFLTQSILGGVGRHWMNPVVWGYVFVRFSWPDLFNKWHMSRNMNGIESTLNPLMTIKKATNGHPMAILDQAGLPKSEWDGFFTNQINHFILDPLSIRLPEGYIDLLTGQFPGFLGEITLFFIVLGGAYLVIRGIIDWTIPFLYAVTYAFVVFLLGGLPFSTGYFSGDILFHMSTGFFWLSCFYLLPDITIAPNAQIAKSIYAVLSGIIVALLRIFSPFQDGVLEGLLLVSAIIPLLNKIPEKIDQNIMKRF